MSARPIDRRTTVLLALAAFMTGGLTGNLTAPEPKPETVTITHPVPPACIEAIDAARSERAHTETERQHDGLAAERSADLADAALSRDDDVIQDAATALDAELRLAQQADLDRADAAAAFDTAAGKCLPERQP
jgi:hypothetical protein